MGPVRIPGSGHVFFLLTSRENMGLRRKSREITLQFLFGHDFQERSCESDVLQAALDEFCHCFDAGRKALPYAHRLILGICEHLEIIDGQITRCSHNWRVERMSLVDRNILRIAVFEMQHVEDVPATVAINEALEIAKRYAEPDSVGFINGILDGMQSQDKM
jgi:N utilization substance protein B